MAEFVMRDMVARAGLTEHYVIASAATSDEEEGNPVYPPARRILAAHGIDSAGKHARQMTWRDYDEYDLLVGMDRYNLRNMERIAGGDPHHKIRLLLDFVGETRDVADPWYTRDFQTTWDDVTRGCEALLRWVESQRER